MNMATQIARPKPLIMEIEFHGETYPVSGMTEGECEKRAKSIYGEDIKVIQTMSQQEYLKQ